MMLKGSGNKQWLQGGAAEKKKSQEEAVVAGDQLFFAKSSEVVNSYILVNFSDGSPRRPSLGRQQILVNAQVLLQSKKVRSKEFGMGGSLFYTRDPGYPSLVLRRAPSHLSSPRWRVLKIGLQK
ncbi:hypothetical protein L3X38_038335 [Prunus dulcis]|uniref:Uncharacterized protein n=1 Tax=Prunus dulcis TaxID=3755 RepID=A0AAD4V6P1_PRUDU|nr:hypothetical protein L3X38_038335 [Prunus dulcis]